MIDFTKLKVGNTYDVSINKNQNFTGVFSIEGDTYKFQAENGTLTIEGYVPSSRNWYMWMVTQEGGILKRGQGDTEQLTASQVGGRRRRRRRSKRRSKRKSSGRKRRSKRRSSGRKRRRSNRK